MKIISLKEMITNLHEFSLSVPEEMYSIREKWILMLQCEGFNLWFRGGTVGAELCIRAISQLKSPTRLPFLVPYIQIILPWLLLNKNFDKKNKKKLTLAKKYIVLNLSATTVAFFSKDKNANV